MADSVTSWLNTAGNHAIDKVRTTELLAELGRTTDEKRRNVLINKICQGNLKLVYTTVKSYSDRRRLRWGTELSADLLQEGVLGLRHAISRYDASRNTRISTIAVPWIKQKLGRYMIQKEQPIYVPENLVHEVNHLKTHGCLSNTKRTPKNTRLVDLARYATAEPLSLDKPMGSDDDAITLADILEQPSTEGSAASQDKAILKLRDLLAQAQVEPKVQDLVMEYAKGGRLSTAATRVKVSQTHARRLVDGAIAKMRKLV
jgi:RNA polymerase sigma factor (sigma-70 family)